MYIRRWTPRAVAAGLISLLLSPIALGHGGVVIEDDQCLLRIGFYQAHFTIYQPQTRAHEQYCEDIPDLGESVFVLEYLHDGLEVLPLDFRIVKNTTGMGQFASWNDLQEVGDLQDVTVYYKAPAVEPDVLTILHRFTEPGEFIGVVTALNPAGKVAYFAVFPFEVGSFGVNYPLLAFALVFLVPLFYWLAKYFRSKGAATGLVFVLVWLSSTDPVFAQEHQNRTVQGDPFTVLWRPSEDPVPINQMHDWWIQLTDSAGKAVTGAVISVQGGMPMHDHGLPSTPRMTQDFGDGRYLIQGMKFHMRGDWVVLMAIQTDDVATVISIELKL